MFVLRDKQKMFVPGTRENMETCIISKGPLCRPAGHNNYLRPADSVKAGGYFFFMREKHLLGPLKGFFM